MTSIELEPPRVSRALSLNQGERPALSRASGSQPRRPTVIHLDDDDDEVQVIEEPPRQRRRLNNNAPDVVIDDDDDEIIFQGRRPAPARNNGRETINLVDSDDEGPIAGPSSARQGGAAPRRRASRRVSPGSFRIFSPPPPPRQYHPIPPVPPVPPPVIAGQLPFAILPPVNPNAPEPNRPPFDEPPQPRAGPSNTANPPRGPIRLGGGLVTHGNIRRRAAPAPHPVDADNYNPRNGWVNELIRIGRLLTAGVRRPAFQLLADPFEDILDHAATINNGYGFRPFANRQAEALGIAHDYKKDMTHKGLPGPGWSYDFGPQESDEGNETAEETLVCAKCLDPLVANTEGMVDVTEEQRKGRRVWGMRCGHVLDGKCIMELMVPLKDGMQPAEEQQQPATDIIPLSSGKPKGKGKGKARAPPTDEVVNVDTDEVVIFPDIPDQQPVSADASGSIRSRLRSHGSISGAPAPVASPPTPRRSTRIAAAPLSGPQSTSVSHAATSTTTTAAASSQAATRQRGRRATGASSKRKRKGAGSGPNGEEIVEERHVWKCPVAGCGHDHESIKVNGVWKTDPEKGAVLMFV